MSYQAIVTRVKVKAHPNADRLRVAQCVGTQVIVGTDVEDGELGIYFPTDGRLTAEFALPNNLTRELGGMFEPHLRIKSIKLRGERSDGYWCPLHYLINAGVSHNTVSNLQEMQTFTELDDIPICLKYETPQTIAARERNQQGRKERSSSSVIGFARHVDTDQLAYYVHEIQAGDLVTVTLKMHGTSQRYGHVMTMRPMNWFDRILNKITFGKYTTAKWQHVIGTRKTVLHEAKNSYYGNEQFRHNVVNGTKLPKGMIIYGEVVGFTTDGSYIMPPCANAKLGKEFLRDYGATTHWTYGCNAGKAKFYVYRITQDGVDLAWEDVQDWAYSLGLECVPQITQFYYDGETDLVAAAELWADGEDLIDSRHIREGVILRVDSDRYIGPRFYKYKSFDFKVLEGIIKDVEGYVDMEESN